MPPDIMLSGKKLGERNRKGGHLELRCLSSQVIITHVLKLCFLGSAWTSAHQWEIVNSLFCFACGCSFAFPIKLSLSQSTSLLAFLLLFPHPMGDVSEQVGGCVAAGQGQPTTLDN